MNRARKCILTVQVNTLLTHGELKKLCGLVFIKHKGRGRRTIKDEKPLGTQHDCYGLIEQVQVNIVGPSKLELDKPRGHPRREDWGKPKRRGKAKRRTTKRRAARDTKKEAKGVTHRKPRPSELRAREARAAAKAAAAAPVAAASGA